MTIFKIFKRDFPKVWKNAHSCLLLSGTLVHEGGVVTYGRGVFFGRGLSPGELSPGGLSSVAPKHVLLLLSPVGGRIIATLPVTLVPHMFLST